jgi:hypothetical protein
MHSNARFIISLAVIGLCGCTSYIASKPIKPGADVVQGLPYFLPATALQLNLSYELRSCDPLKLVVTRGTITEVLVPDPKQRFMIDTSIMSSPSKTVAPAKFEFNNGLITKLSYDVSDKSGDIIGQAVSLPANVALFKVTKATSATQAPKYLNLPAFEKFKAVEGSAAPKCQERVKSSLRRLQQLTGDEHVLFEQWRTSVLQSAVQPGKQEREAVSSALKAKLDGIRAEIATTKSSLALSLEGGITVRPKPTYRNGIVDFEVDTTPQLPAAAFLKWFEDEPETISRWLNSVSLKFTFDPCDGCATQQPVCVDEKKFCHRVPVFVPYTLRANDIVVATGTAKLFQGGPLLALDLSNTMFHDNSYELVFGSGEVTSYTYQEKAAAAANALKSLNDAVTGMTSDYSKQLDAEKEMIQKNTDLLDAYTDYVESKKKYEDALNKSKETATSD